METSIFDRVTDSLASQNKPIVEALPGIVEGLMRDRNAQVVYAPTGSGKSIGITGALADYLAKNPSEGEDILICVPRTVLATNLAKTLAEMTGTDVGDYIGYAIGNQAGGAVLPNDNRKPRIVVATYGYALHAGLIDGANLIILDETHEEATDIALARAIAHKRLSNGESLRVVEMSATLNPDQQFRYWQEVSPHAQLTHIEGEHLACEIRHIIPEESTPAAESIADIVSSLLNEGRKGVGVFRCGVKEVKATKEAVLQMLQRKGVTDIEVRIIYGDMTKQERAQATEPPAPGKRVVLIGTPVLESGLNIEWLDCAVSDGFGNVPYYRPETGANALVREDLPIARLTQQKGRVNRFSDITGFDAGIFVLFSHQAWEGRTLETSPELSRCSLNETAFRAAALGYHPADLTFNVPLPEGHLDQARGELMRLGLIDEYWLLTNDGDYIRNLPASPETGAMLCEARRLDAQNLYWDEKSNVLRDAIALAAIIEVGGLRANTKKPHGQDDTSDLLDALRAFWEVQAAIEGGSTDIANQCWIRNISERRFTLVTQMIDDISARLRDDLRKNKADAPKTADDVLQRVILNGSVNHLFAATADGNYRDVIRDDGYHGLDYAPVRSSVLNGEKNHPSLVTAHLREIPPSPDEYREEPYTLLTDTTAIRADVILAWAAEREQSGALTDIELTKAESKGRNKGKRARGDLDAPETLSAHYFGLGELRIPIPPTEEAQRYVKELLRLEQQDYWVE